MSRFVLCCVSTKALSEDFHRSLAEVLTKHQVQSEKHIHLSNEGLWALDMPVVFKNAGDANAIKKELVEISNKFEVDLAILPDHPIRSNHRLILFDMDSTLIQHEVIVEMAHDYGVGEQVKAITERAMQGELGFDDALRERIALLKGFPKSKMEAIAKRLKLTPGAKKLIEVVKTHGYKTAIVSGGFMYFAEEIQRQLGIDYVYANVLEWEGDHLSGEVTGQIVNAEFKEQMVVELAKQENLTLEQVVAVGDGANDIPMLLKAGLGIAFHAKEKVRAMSRHQLSHSPMNAILYFLGFNGNHHEAL